MPLYESIFKIAHDFEKKLGARITLDHNLLLSVNFLLESNFRLATSLKVACICKFLRS